MTSEKVKEKLLQHVGDKIIEESKEFNRLNNLISAVSLHGIERGDDGYPLISDAIRDIYVSEQKTNAYLDLMEFIEEIEV